MRKILLGVAMLCASLTAQAQVSYQQMRSMHRDAAPGYTNPAWITPLAGSDKFVLFEGDQIFAADYANPMSKSPIFKALAGTEILSFVESPNKQMALYEVWDNGNPRKEIYRHSYTSTYYISCADHSTVKIDDVRDISFSPDNRHLAMSYNNDLFLYDLATNDIYNITDDGEWNHIINGTSDWVYEEEYGFTKAYAFSPDGKEIAYLKFDESLVPEFEMMRFDNTLYNKAYSFKYPKAGDKNSVVTLHVYNIETKETRQINTGEETDQYIPRIDYTPAGNLFYYRVNRLQNKFEVILVESNGMQKIIYNECDERYVERPSAENITFIDGERFIVREETSTGWFHLYLHSVDKGRLNAITSGEWEVTQFVGISPNKKTIYYMSTEQAPEERNLYSIGLNGKNKKCLLADKGYWRVYPSANMNYFAAEHSSAEKYPTAAIYDTRGRKLHSLMDDVTAPEVVAPKLQRKFSTFTTERGDVLSYYIVYPEDFDPTKRYPVLMTQYSGPGSQQVANRASYDWEETLALNGYIVACCDGRGTGYRGEEFKKVTYANLGHCEVEDQLSFANYLAAQEFIDSERIGIYGWSFGGFMALNCALKGDGIFKMAIAVAPVTSWRYYDTIYTEIYNGLPQQNPEGYDNNSPIQYADRLSDNTRLIIIHGTADDNVHFQNAMEMCRALNRAGKQYDMMVYPDQNHSMRPHDTVNVRQKMVDYCLENL